MDIVIFGISGDLSRKKVLPALESLYIKNELPQDLRIIGFSRTLPELGIFSFSMLHVSGNYDSIDDFNKLKSTLRKDKKQFFYLAVPPSTYSLVLKSLHESEIITKDDESDQKMILIEKPFGRNLQESLSLAKLVADLFRSDQVLKIDHYAGKKELRELKEYDLNDISSLSFKILEKDGVEKRGSFYDQVGALHDVGQNHLLFMLGTFFSNGGKQNEKKREEHINSLFVDPKRSNDLVFAQHEGYRMIDGVHPQSTKETFFSIPLRSNKKEFEHIDIILEAGKSLPASQSSIGITFSSGEKEEIILSSGTEAYENIFKDALRKKENSFLSDEEVFASWKLIDQIDELKKGITLTSYSKGNSPFTP